MFDEVICKLGKNFELSDKFALTLFELTVFNLYSTQLLIAYTGKKSYIKNCFTSILWLFHAKWIKANTGNFSMT